MKQSARGSRIRKLVLAALFLALEMLLPMLTGQIPQIGMMLSPMHIPALLCGFICGWPWALVVGFVSPLLRSLLFGMPPLFPVAFAMAFELAAYGVAAALLYKIFPKRMGYVYLSLILSMLVGRGVWGLVTWIVFRILGNPFTLGIFFSSAFLGTLPGIIAQLILIPPLVISARKARLMD